MRLRTLLKPSEVDFVDSDGIIYGHIRRVKKREMARKIAVKLKEELPSVKLRLLKAQGGYDIYGDYYQFL